MGNFQVARRNLDDCIIFRLKGDFDGYQVTTKLENDISKLGYKRHYIFNLLEVDLLNSLGISLLHVISNELNKNHKKLFIVVDKKSRIFKLFKIHGFSEYVKFYDTEKEARRKIAQIP